MSKNRFTEAQIMGVLRQVEGGMELADVCREHGISSARPARVAGSIHVRNNQGGAGLRHKLALDLQQRPPQHGARRDYSRSET